MKKETILTLAASFALLFSCGIQAQAQEYVAPPVEISAEKVRIGGKLYYSHRVLERQTLFSISKAYQVSIQDIEQANPDLREKGLREGSIILVPAWTSQQPRTAQPQTQPGDGKAAQEPAGKDTVRRERPAPVKSDDTKDSVPAGLEDIDYSIHTVRWYENLQSIARKYNISEELLIAFNNLETTVLKKRQKLRIPDREYIAHAEKLVKGSAPSAAAAGGISESANTAAAETPDRYGKNTKKQAGTPLAVSLVLPLECAPEGDAGNVNYMDFYSGALLAARKLGEEGTRLQIYTYDTFGYNSCSDIAQEAGLRSSDIIIGPVSPKDMEEMLRSTDVPAISPLDPRTEALVPSNPGLIHAPAPVESQYGGIAEMLRGAAARSETVLVLSEVGGYGDNDSRMAENALTQMGIEYKTFKYNILQGRGVNSGICALLDNNGHNNIVIASENEAFVNDAVRNLNTIATMNKYRLSVYGTAKLRNFETIETEHFHNTDTHLAMAYYVDYDDPETMEFIMEYRALFNTEPTPFAFQGYDMMKLAASLAERSREGIQAGQIPEQHLLQSNVLLKKVSPEGGYVNIATRDIEYTKGYNVSVIGQ